MLLVVRYSIELTIDYRQIIIKTDLVRNENWQKEMTLTRNRGIFYIRDIANDGGAYLIRNLENVFYAQIMKLDSNRQEQWEKNFVDVFQLEEILFVGESSDGTAVYFYYLSSRQIPVSVTKINSENGNTLWDKALPDSKITFK